MKIKKIKKIGKKEQTVDIEVEDTHSYQLSNGIVVHNSVSKLFGLTEGWHLPSMARYLRWVQFKNGDPLIKKYEKSGYPTKELVKYQGSTIIGFPTEPEITKLMNDDMVVTASEATLEEQFKWLQLGEKYWINGVDENGEPLDDSYGGQISYTMKYDPNKTSYNEFYNMINENQPNVKCCSVMPQINKTAYEYQPEQPVSKVEFEKIRDSIGRELKEDVDKVHVDCDSGACPIDFNKE